MNQHLKTKVDGLLFDKDGTLFEFHATWNVWTGQVIARLAEGDEAKHHALAEVLGFDLDTGDLSPNSVVVAHPVSDIVEAIHTVLPTWEKAALTDYLNADAGEAPLAPAADLDPLLSRLVANGLALGVMTNDAEIVAQTQLAQAGVKQHFDFIAGYDSGYGAKPMPEPLLAFAQKLQLAPERVAMVGDSVHDLLAGRAAGMQTIAVLTGLSEAEDLAPYADVILPNIGHIPEWLTS